MPGVPFQSKLEPHFDFILAARRERQTWKAIAKELTVKGTVTTPQAVHAFIKRRLKRRYPLGVAPDEPMPAVPPARVQEPTAENHEFTELLPPSSEFEADPLTLPPRVKAKPMWGVLKPKPNS